MRVWLDDRRPAPEGWVRVQTPEETIELLNGGEVEAISLDHDLGSTMGQRERTGYDVLKLVEDEVEAAEPPAVIEVHAGNVAVIERMEQAIGSFAWVR